MRKFTEQLHDAFWYVIIVFLLPSPAASLLKYLARGVKIKMDKELVSGKVGADGSYSVKIEGAKFLVKGGYKVGAFGLGLELELGIKDALIALKEKIPGKIDDALIDFIVSELDKPAVV